ncbi:MAG: hypothetical protein AB7O97_02645 [Planctomycetota bacterium]
MLRSTLWTLALTGVSAALPAQACFDPNLGTNLALTDDSISAALPLGFTFTFGGVGYTDIIVCSNGYIWLGATPPVTGAADFSSSEAELLSNQPRICPLWTDMNPSAVGSGNVWFNTGTGTATVTWDGVIEFGGSNILDVQLVLDSANGITITYGANAAVGGTFGGTVSVLIGASVGNGAASNLVSFASRPLVIGQDTFCEVIPTNGSTPIPYNGFQMGWNSTAPGYLVIDNACIGPASVNLVGQGCPPPQSQSLYEVFGTGTGDLNGLDLSFLPTGASSYLALPGLSPTYFTAFSNNLAMTDDQSVFVTLPFNFPFNGGTVGSIYVSSNGFITLGATDPGSGCCTGVPATMTAGPPRISAWWADLFPPGGGGVYADADPVSGDFVVSWDQVPEYSAGAPQSCQIALSPTGQFTIRWQSVSAGTHTFLAGFSFGNGATDLGPTDLSAVTSSPVSGTLVTPLTLEAQAGSTPQINSAFTMNVNNIQSLPNGNICVLLISNEIPATDVSFLGLTGCTAFLALPELASVLNLSLGAPTSQFVLNIPNDPNFLGVSLMSQAVSDDLTANPFGFRVSNGARLNFGP